jgi:mevalonate kinase
MVKATAPGKVILFGEHAVVYGRPAIAVPLSLVRATAVIQPHSQQEVRLLAPDLSIDTTLAAADDQDALALAVRQVQTAAGLDHLPPMKITVTSDIPIASGLGSGASITAAIIRALVAQLGLTHLATNQWISQLTYEVEKVYHGTPSGIDNTVVAYEQPVYFVRRSPQNIIETFVPAKPLRLLVADTGISSSTKSVVAGVRRAWQADPGRFEKIFDGCAEVALAGRAAVQAGDLPAVGRLMIRNQALLVEMTVSSRELDHLVQVAIDAGALGAKLSGGGRGGNMIALVTAQSEESVYEALAAAGARAILRNQIG